jgi:hypothetical protein
MLSDFLSKAAPELERLSKLVQEAAASGKFKEVKKHTDKIAEIVSWGTQIEQIEFELNRLPAPKKSSLAVQAPASPTYTTQAAASSSTAAKEPPVAYAPAPAALVQTPDKKIRRLVPDVTEEDRLKAKRVRFSGRLKDFFDRVRSEQAEASWSWIREAQIKGLIAEGRSLEAAAADLKDPARGLIRDEIQILGAWWDDNAFSREYFALNFQRTHSPEIWEEVSHGYQFLASAESAVGYMETEEGLNDSQFLLLAELAAAAEAYLGRVFEDRAMNVWDPQQKEVHQRLEKLNVAVPTVTRWWRRLENAPSLDDLAKRAKGLAAEEESIRKSRARAESSTSALQNLLTWFETAHATEFDEAALLKLVEAALAAGVPPSSKPLRTAMFGYRHALEGSSNRDVMKLDSYLQKDQLEASRKAMPDPIEEVEVDTELLNKVAALKPLTEGKTILFVGGSKRQGWRKNEYEKLLGLNELLWPEAEEWTRTEDLSGYVNKADIVCLLIRFSRHSYKNVLDVAKERGKHTVTLPRGLGMNTVVHEMWSQLIPATDGE